MNDQEKKSMLKRSEEGIEQVRSTVMEIIQKVQQEGDEALKAYSLQFDHCDLNQYPLKVSEAEFQEAEKLLSPEIKEAIQFAIANVKKFHKRQTVESLPMEEILPGVFAGEKRTPIESVAIYVPNGRGNFPSMLYMAAIPALLAKVERIVVTSPPNIEGKVDPATLFACQCCGIKEVYRIGGAQAIAAFAYGTKTIQPCVKVIGPGSRFVTAAKRILYGTIDVGLPAGPSESIILADEKADPYLTALDLLTESEHGSDSAALLITPSEKLLDEVQKEMERQLATLGKLRSQFVCDVFSGYGGFILTQNMEEAIEVVNQIATEHLQLAVADPHAVEAKIKNAGEILLGHTPFAAANYAIGPNAILPTGGNARTFSAVSVRDFYKFSSIIETTKEGLDQLIPHVEKLAKYEGFETHRNALVLRKKE